MHSDPGVAILTGSPWTVPGSCVLVRPQLVTLAHFSVTWSDTCVLPCVPLISLTLCPSYQPDVAEK